MMDHQHPIKQVTKVFLLACQLHYVACAFTLYVLGRCFGGYDERFNCICLEFEF